MRKLLGLAAAAAFVLGQTMSAQAADALQSGVINNTGTLAANTLTQKDGVIRLSASQALVEIEDLR